MLLAIGSWACSATDEGHDGPPRSSGKQESSSGAIAPPPNPYRVTTVTQSGTISGRVLIDGDLPRDTTITVTPAGSLCGATVPDQSLVHSGNTLANAVVWVTDARSGRPLPVERRFEIVHEHCVVGPRVIAATVGSTINVRNEDSMDYRLHALREGTHDTLGVFTMSDEGQVVPSDKIAKAPGLVVIDCDQHPWAKAWVAVFDHPYFAVTSTDGAFKIDSLPPGTYHLRIWHERAKAPVEEQVDVKPGADATLEVKLSLK
jgi:carboxypeptidase family protein